MATEPTKEPTKTSPTTEPKIVTVAANTNADGIYYYSRPSKDVSSAYSNPIGRVPGEVGGTANIDAARGSRQRPIKGNARSGSGWYESSVTASPILKYALFGVLAYMILK